VNRTPEEIVRELERTIPVFQEEADRAMHEAVDLTHMRTSEAAPKGRTGALSSKITAITRANSTGVSGTVRPRVIYAKYVNDGSGLEASFQGPRGGGASASPAAKLLGLVQAGKHHAITPKAARGPRAALKFADGAYRRSSRGTPATHFIDRTREGTAVEVERILTDGAVKADRRLFP
jgi:hypothetical protein